MHRVQRGEDTQLIMERQQFVQRAAGPCGSHVWPLTPAQTIQYSFTILTIPDQFHDAPSRAPFYTLSPLSPNICHSRLRIDKLCCDVIR